MELFFFHQGKWHTGHSRRPRRGHLLQLALFRQREIKTAVGPKVGQRRLRLVLDLIFLTDNHRRAIGLKDHHVGRNVDGLRVPGRLLNIHLRRSCTRRNHNECAEQSQTRTVSPPHCALPSAERVPRGRRTCESVTCSISASTSAASFSRAVFIASKSPSEYFPERYSNRRSRRLS